MVLAAGCWWCGYLLVTGMRSAFLVRMPHIYCISLLLGCHVVVGVCVCLSHCVSVFYPATFLLYLTGDLVRPWLLFIGLTHMRHSSANSDLCTHFSIARPCGTTPRGVRDRLGNRSCIIRLTVPALQQGSDNLCEQVCREVIALMITEWERKVPMKKTHACDVPPPAGA